MVAPSELEIQNEPKLKDLSEAIGINEFIRAAHQWLRLALSNREGAVMFYFSGIGKEISRADPIMLLQDFGDPEGPFLRGAVSVNNLFYGLSPNEHRASVARTQLFFVDASRTTLPGVHEYELANPTPVFDAKLLGIDDRCAPIFYAAQPGGQAYAQKGQQSLFSAALIDCLNGAAAIQGTDADCEVRWVVTISSLIEGIQKLIAHRSDENKPLYEKNKITQTYSVSGVAKDAAIHWLDKAPSVNVTFEIEGANGNTAVDIINEMNEVVVRLAPSSTLHRETKILPAGLYRAQFKSSVQNNPEGRVSNRARLVLPPGFNWKIKV